jgi:hypothetical protein
MVGMDSLLLLPGVTIKTITSGEVSTTSGASSEPSVRGRARPRPLYDCTYGSTVATVKRIAKREVWIFMIVVG